MTTIQNKKWTCLFKSTSEISSSIGLLLVRLVMGLAMTLHGYAKVPAFASWMNQAGGENAPPAFFQGAATAAEFIGGMLLMLGLFTRLNMVFMAITMLVATMLHLVVLNDPFVSTGGSSYELAMLYLVLSVSFFLTGAGRISLDSLIHKFITKNN